MIAIKIHEKCININILFYCRVAVILITEFSYYCENVFLNINDLAMEIKNANSIENIVTYWIYQWSKLKQWTIGIWRIYI